MKSAVTNEIVSELNFSILDDHSTRLVLADHVIRLLRTSEPDFPVVKQTTWYRALWQSFGGTTLETVALACQRLVQAQSLAAALLRLALAGNPYRIETVALIARELDHIKATFGDWAVPDSDPLRQVVELSRQAPQESQCDEKDLPEQTRLFIIRAMIATAMIDGRLDETEVELISRKIESLCLSEEGRSSIRSEIFDPQPFKFSAEGLDSYKVRYLLYKNVAAVVMADGVIHVKEKAFIERLVRDLGIKRQDAARIEHELTRTQSHGRLDALVAAIVKTSARKGATVTELATGDERIEPARRRLAESWLTYIGTVADFSRGFVQAPVIRRIEAYHGSANIMTGLDVMNEAAVRDEIFGAAEAFCTLSSRSIDDELRRAFPSLGSAPGALWSETAAEQVAASMREDLQECLRQLSDVSGYQEQLRGLDQAEIDELNGSILQGIQLGGTLLGLESGVVSTAALHGTYGWFNRERLDPVVVDLFDTYSDSLGRFYLGLDEALDSIVTHFWEIGAGSFESTLSPALDVADLDSEQLWQFQAPFGAPDDRANQITRLATRTETKQAGLDDVQIQVVCRQCGAAPAEKELWGKRFCDDCYEKTDVQSFIKTAVKRSITLGRVYTAPDIPPTKIRNARQKCRVPDEDATVALIDCTLFGSAHDCVLFTELGIYGRNLGAPAYFIPYESLKEASIIESVDDINCIWVGEKGLMNLKGSDVPRNEMIELLKRLQRLVGEEWNPPEAD